MSNLITFPSRLAPPVDKATYSIEDVMRLTGLGRGLVYAALRDGTIPARKVGSRWLIPKQRFHEWLNSPSEDQKGSA